MRGVALIVAVTVAAEVGDFRRFANPRQLMAYLGLVPSEHSSGSTVRRGGITKAGNALARRVLIEGAWTYRMPARVSRKLHDRLEPLPAGDPRHRLEGAAPAVRALSASVAAGKPKVVVTTAIAREMVGFIWAIARVHSLSPAVSRRRTDEKEGRSQSRSHGGRQAAVGNPRACYEPASGRRSPLERGSPKTQPRSCGSQPAHESLFNRRLLIHCLRSGGRFARV